MSTKKGLSTVVIVIVLAVAIVAAVLIANKVILAPKPATIEETTSKAENKVETPVATQEMPIESPAPTPTTPIVTPEPTPAPAPKPEPTPAPEPAKPTIHTVNISGFAFANANLQIKKGDSVVWVNQDSAPHTATASVGTFDTGTLNKGQSSQAVTFATAGTHSYVCTFHPSMKGTITVTE
ncbi:MAG TPA: plastocyanin/azurin family copper-binding protein [Candidatus Paceibacterota bacterium]